MLLVILLKKRKMRGKRNRSSAVLITNLHMHSITAGKGILTSALATAFCGFTTTILFLFCTPDLQTLFSIQADQPFVLLYALALGKKASIFMTIIAILGLVMVNLF